MKTPCCGRRIKSPTITFPESVGMTYICDYCGVECVAGSREGESEVILVAVRQSRWVVLQTED